MNQNFGSNALKSFGCINSFADCIAYIPRELLVSEVEHHLHKKFTLLGLFFQDHETQYMRISFGGANMCKIGEKGVFLVMVTI